MDPLVVESQITDKTRALIVNSPHDSKGSHLSESVIRDLADLCADRSIFLLSHEVFADLLFEKKTPNSGS